MLKCGGGFCTETASEPIRDSANRSIFHTHLVRARSGLTVGLSDRETTSEQTQYRQVAATRCERAEMLHRRQPVDLRTGCIISPSSGCCGGLRYPPTLPSSNSRDLLDSFGGETRRQSRPARKWSLGLISLVHHLDIVVYVLRTLVEYDPNDPGVLLLVVHRQRENDHNEAQ